MGQVIVRDLDDRVLSSLQTQAERHGRSLEQEVRDILTRAASPSWEAVLADLDLARSLTPPGPRLLAEDLVRADRGVEVPIKWVGRPEPM